MIPCWQIIAVDKKVNLDDVCLTEPLACCVHSVRKARIRFAETVVIIGMGIMGYFHLKLALMRGARVIVSETDPSRQAFAREQGSMESDRSASRKICMKQSVRLPMDWEQMLYLIRFLQPLYGIRQLRS